MTQPDHEHMASDPADSKQRFLSEVADAILEHEDALAPYVEGEARPFASQQVLSRTMTRAQRAMPRTKPSRMRASGPVARLILAGPEAGLTPV